MNNAITYIKQDRSMAQQSIASMNRTYIGADNLLTYEGKCIVMDILTSAMEATELGRTDILLTLIYIDMVDNPKTDDVKITQARHNWYRYQNINEQLKAIKDFSDDLFADAVDRDTVERSNTSINVDTIQNLEYRELYYIWYRHVDIYRPSILFAQLPAIIMLCNRMLK